ncbi:hypothetical protein Ahy_A01g002127 isoform C [Arachis hypogaea]|uniref:Uncharacterized protein n=1 Tax=Arachis hypogaea TaxID=3818 RepID=A0A445EQ49_ARAHY|nr:hypothetical protein Ahy_A01g002127 isoform C [Arachis hypogaea]
MEATDDAESPAPIASPKLAGTVNWGTTTVIGIFAGMLYGGSKEAAASVVSSDYKRPRFLFLHFFPTYGYESVLC